jgi:hypothetical protein
LKFFAVSRGLVTKQFNPAIQVFLSPKVAQVKVEVIFTKRTQEIVQNRIDVLTSASKSVMRRKGSNDLFLVRSLD